MSADGRAGEFGPDSYRDWRANTLGAITERLEQRLMLRLAGSVAGGSVLDVGCGDGALTRLLSRGGAARAIGCDPDCRMIATAAASADGTTARYLVGRAENLPFAGGSFDLVTIVTVLAFIPEPAPALREIARVLRPGGRLIVGDLGRWSSWALSRRLRARLGGATMWQAASFRSAGQLRSLVAAAGLRVEQVAGAIFYPRCAAIARLMAPVDAGLGRLTTFGAAFIAVAAVKPEAEALQQRASAVTPPA